MKEAAFSVQPIVQTQIAQTQIDPQTQQQLLRDMRKAVSDLRSVDSWAGLFRFVSIGSVTIGLSLLTWQASQLSLFLLGAIATSITYTFWLICDHDATHRTLTGWNWFDTLMPRLISWPMLLPIGTYNQLHQLHHGHNGIDLQDPERVQWTNLEYQAALPWQRWYVRHQWAVDIFLFGSMGLAVKTIVHSIKLRNKLPELRRQMMIDVLGILGMQAIIISLLAVQSVSLWRYLLFWMVLERGIGIIMQTRDHVEHYGLWLAQENYQLTQLYACRNVKTLPWIDWLMGGLPYHSVHHAFPQIASSHLAEAFERIQSVLQRYSLPPMAVGSGYISTSLELNRQPCLIKEASDQPASACSAT